MDIPENAFEAELITLMHRHGLDELSNTPDYLLAAYVRNCIEAYVHLANAREQCSREFP